MQEHSQPDEGAIGKFVPNFQDHAEEVRFRASRAAGKFRETRATLVLFVVVSSSFAPLDAWLFTEDLTRLLVLRLGLVNAVLVAALALTFVPWLARNTFLLTSAVTILYVVFYALFTDIADAPPLYISGIVMLFFGIYAIAPCAMRWQFVSAGPAPRFLSASLPAWACFPNRISPSWPAK